MVRVTFEVVRLRATRRWSENGKRRQETRVFEQTINPWNRNAEGLPKTRTEIVKELQMEREAWLKAFDETWLKANREGV